LLGLSGNFESRRHDAGIARAPADMAADNVFDLHSAGIRHPVKQIGQGHKNTRRAITALQGVVFAKCPLQRIQFPVIAGQTFDGFDRHSIRLNRQIKA
jgi:hypothetical protein